MNKFEQILNASPNPVIICDKNHRIDTVNKAVVDSFGYSDTELSGKKIYELIPAFQEGWDVVEEAIHSYEGKFTAFKKNQDFLSIYLNITDFDYDHEEYKAIWIYNIMPLSNVNKALQESQQRLNAVINTAVDGIITISTRGIIESINPAGAKLFGYEPHEVIGENIMIFMPEPYRSAHDGYLKNYQRTRQAKIIGIGREVEGQKKDGTIFPFNLSTSEVILDDRVIYTGIIHDITEQKEAKEKLHRLNIDLENRVEKRTRELATLVNQLEVTNLHLEEEVQERKLTEEELEKSQLLYTKIAENFPNGIISVINQELKYLFIEGKELKKQPEDWLGHSIFERFDSEYHKELEIKLRNAFLGTTQTFELPIHDELYILYVVPLQEGREPEGNQLQLLIVEKNVTELRKAEEETYKSLQKEKQLNELKTRFVSMASHEFRTPLSTILSSSSLIARYDNDETKPKREKHIARIQSSVKNLTSILNDFLSLDKLEQGKIMVNPIQFDMVVFAKELIDEIENMLKNKQEIVYTHQGEVGVVSDQNVLKNICLNLLSNAIKYSNEGQKILFQSKIENQKVSIWVQDYGIGIPEEEQSHLFERFFRAQNATNIQGTGLGLNIVKKYVDLLDGEIHFESKENEGTTFCVSFKIENHEKDIAN